MNPIFSVSKRRHGPLSLDDEEVVTWIRENKPDYLSEVVAYVPCDPALALVLYSVPVIEKLILRPNELVSQGDESESDTEATSYIVDTLPMQCMVHHVVLEDVFFPETVHITRGVTHLSICGCHGDLVGWSVEDMIETGGLTHVTVCDSLCPDLQGLENLGTLTLDMVKSPTMPSHVDVLHLRSSCIEEFTGLSDELFLERLSEELTFSDPSLLRLRVHKSLVHPMNMHALMHVEMTMDCFPSSVSFPALRSLKMVQTEPTDMVRWMPDFLARHKHLELLSLQGPPTGVTVLLDMQNSATTLLLIRVHLHLLLGAKSLSTILVQDSTVCVETLVPVRKDFTVEEFPLLAYHV